MLPSRTRSGSWGGRPGTPPSSSRSTPPRHGRSSSAAAFSPPSSEGDGGGGGGGGVMERVVTQLEEELRAEREEKARAQQELMELQSNSSMVSDASSERMQVLEREVAAAKETEVKMLESLIRQTRELEQAKIALEEAKLEADTLRQGHGGGAAAAETSQWSVMDLMFGGVDEEINGLRAKLRAAVQAEERSRKAADDLTAALSAVTMEAKQVKAWLSDAQAELEGANAEVERLNGLLHTAEAELWSTTEQLDGITSEWKDAAASWRAREKLLLGRVRATEGEADAARQENAELAELHRVVDDENVSLRRALERAVEEANASSESLELATSENSKLRDALSEKDDAMELLRRENSNLRASEAAAKERAKELDGQIAATAKERAKEHDGQLVAAARKPADGGAGEKGAELPLPLEKWRPAAGGGGDMHEKLSAASFLDSSRLMTGRKDRMFASLSNIAELRSAAAAAAMDDLDYEFDHFDGGQYGDLGHAVKHRKRRSILRKFGDFFRRRRLYKRDLAPVLHYQ